MQFDLTDLALFRDVVEAGSITWGAERAHLALAAASTRIRNMEVSLGATLLDRGRHGVTPTAAGRALLAHARAILGQADRLREDLSVYAGGAAGNVRVLSNTNALTEFLPELLGSFLTAHPLVTVDVEERLSDEIVAAIADGTGDIGIVAGTVETGDLETFPFRQDRFVLVASPTHPLGGRDSVTFAEVLDHDLVGLDRAAALQRFLSDRAARAGRRLRLRVQLRSFDAICRLVEGNVGIGIVPETTARRAARTADIRCIALSDAWAVRDLKVCTRGRSRLPRFAKLLADHLLAEHPLGGTPGVSIDDSDPTPGA
ncbi:LysR family transcriptional regulator [Nitrospirillum sp. BR 11752]|uniref:LysR family transcriptional regulator n=1 Tax=Nitrospirillum sp. BR 11752 TaxID=3104293 RepID=UPI002EC0743C|nr:LysR family transcriptional regulator [Nitrospirillum sp. BR 11752]